MDLMRDAMLQTTARMLPEMQLSDCGAVRTAL